MVGPAISSQSPMRTPIGWLVLVTAVAAAVMEKIPAVVATAVAELEVLSVKTEALEAATVKAEKMDTGQMAKAVAVSS